MPYIADMARTLTIHIKPVGEALQGFTRTFTALEAGRRVSRRVRILEKYGLVRITAGRRAGKRKVKVPEALFGEIALKIAI